MGVVNLAKKYSKKVDEKFAQKSITDRMGGMDFDITGVKTVVTYEIDDAREQDYKRTGTNRYGTPEELGDQIHEDTMTQDKSFTFTIDRGNNTQQMMLKEAGKRLANQIKSVSVPNRDRYNIHVASFVAKMLGQIKSNASITKTNIYEKFLEVMEEMDEANVPTEGRLNYSKPKMYNLLKRCDEFTKNVDAGKKLKINGSIGDIDDTAIIKARSKFFPSGVDMLFVHPKGWATPKQLESYKIHDNPPGINGWLVEGRMIYDAFYSRAKKAITWIIAGSEINLTTESYAGETVGATKIDVVKANVGKEVKYMYKLDTSKITAPAEGSTTTTGYTDLPTLDSTDIAAGANTHYMVIALIDGKVFASGGGTIVKK